MISMLETVEDDFEMLSVWDEEEERVDISALLQEYGYQEDMDTDMVNRAAVTKRLQELCNIRCEYEEEPILWCEREKKTERAYLVYPVMLSLLLKEYECTEKLIEQGYSIDDVYLGEQVYSYREGDISNISTICIQQVIMSQEDIPEKLLNTICNELFYTMPAFCLGRDYWYNPLLNRWGGIPKTESLPSIRGLTRLFENKWEILEGMLRETTHSVQCEIRNLQNKVKKQLAMQLLTYFEGLGEDMTAFLDMFSPSSQMNSWFFATEEAIEWLRIWMKLLPRIKTACSYSDVSEKAFFEHIAELLVCVLEFEPRDNMQEEERTRILDKLRKMLESSCPQEYSVGDYVDYLEGSKEWPKYVTYLKLWKTCLRRPMVLDRLDATLWNMLEKIFGEPEKEDECKEITGRSFNKELRLQQAIAFMELLDEVEDQYRDADANGEALAELFENIMDFESEELLLACLKNKLVIRESISVLIQSALKFEKLRLIPVLILYQNRNCA